MPDYSPVQGEDVGRILEFEEIPELLEEVGGYLFEEEEEFDAFEGLPDDEQFADGHGLQSLADPEGGFIPAYFGEDAE